MTSDESGAAAKRARAQQGMAKRAGRAPASPVELGEATSAVSAYRPRLAARMIAIADQIVASEGLGAVQARRIAREADCSVGTLYNVFGGLDGLVLAVNRGSLEALGARLETAARAAAGGTAEQRLSALALAYRDFAFGETPRWRTLFEHRMERDAPVPDDYRAYQAKLFELVERSLAEALEADSERATAARALFSAVHGIVSLSLDNKLGRQGYVETELQIRFLLRTVSRGLELSAGDGRDGA